MKIETQSLSVDGRIPVYRVYYAQNGISQILLLCAGTKRTQAKDIEKARAYWKDYKSRSG